MAVAKKDKSPKEIDYDKIDIMNRSEWVDKVYDLIESLPLDNRGASFAIDGKWGSGKTFVLNMLTEKLEGIVKETDNAEKENKKSDRKYLVFNYNAWENDYYDEPLLSIVSVMVDELNSIGNGKRKATAIGKICCIEIASILGTVLSNISKDIIGVDIKNIASEISEKLSNVKNKYGKITKNSKISNDFDTNIGFKLAINLVKSAIEKLAEHFTIVFIVDELDRCMPEYAIKVMERTHHVFNKEKKTVQILSVDKSQLDESIKKIFGSKVALEEYFDKFITFTVKLDDAIMTEKFNKKFEDVMSNYIIPDKFKEVNFAEIINPVLQQLNIRKRIQVLDKIVLIHRYAIKEKSCISVFIYEILYYIINISPQKNREDKKVLNDKKNEILKNVQIVHMDSPAPRKEYFQEMNMRIQKTVNTTIKGVNTELSGREGLINLLYVYFNFPEFTFDVESQYSNYSGKHFRYGQHEVGMDFITTVGESVDDRNGFCLLFNEACKLIC